MSAKIALAPVYSTACAVAVCVCDGTIISSPFLKPEAKQDKCNAAVQLDRVIAYLELVKEQMLFQIMMYIFHELTIHSLKLHSQL